jgi:hypothetical protein
MSEPSSISCRLELTNQLRWNGAVLEQKTKTLFWNGDNDISGKPDKITEKWLPVPPARDGD